MNGLNIAPQTLMQGDNLAFLRAINSECIDLIATDPPFNKGKDFHATPDSLAAGASFHDRWSWDNDVEQEWVDEIQDDWAAVWEVIDAANAAWGKDMGAFLCYMGVRLLEMHRVLKPTGSLYLHCDDTAGPYLTLLQDAIFGRRNRRAIVAWRRYGAHSDAKNFGRVYDTILFYAKDGKGVWNGAWREHDPEYIQRTYRHEDERGRFRTGPLHTGGLQGGGVHLRVQGLHP